MSEQDDLGELMGDETLVPSSMMDYETTDGGYEYIEYLDECVVDEYFSGHLNNHGVVGGSQDAEEIDGSDERGLTDDSESLIEISEMDNTTEEFSR